MVSVVLGLFVVVLWLIAANHERKMDLTAVKVKELESDLTDLRCRVVQLEGDVTHYKS